MNAFEYANAPSVEAAVKLLTPADAKTDPDLIPRPLAGGQDLLTTMKAYITPAPRVVNLKTIAGLDKITAAPDGSLKIGALATLTAIEEHETIRKNFPGLAQAAHSVATPQIRNLGTVGGNLCQRPRCWYFRLENVKCLKKGGTECYAATGQNKYNAIIAGGPSYIAHPSDLAPMLIALNATLTINGPAAPRTIPVQEFFILPKVSVRRENVLKPGEIVTEIQIPASPMAANSTYLKFKERESLDFAMAAVAAAVELNADKTVKEARIVLAGVAPIPWRVPDAEKALVGKKIDKDSLANIAQIALADAEPLEHNAYKVPLTQTLIRRVLTTLNA
jgi:xanthine dehydrogenase YagS FAD-binding subunit